MAGIEFDRQAFVPTDKVDTKGPLVQLLGPALIVVALAAVVFVAYKVFLVRTQESDLAAANAQVHDLQQQLGEMQKRLDTLEKHRKPAEAATVSPAPASPAPAKPKTVYHVAAASALPPQPKPAPPAAPLPVAKPTAAIDSALAKEIASDVEANHQAWEATTNRLADVVGVIGTQQGEIAATRDTVNELLAQTRRHAVSFELSRNNRTSVGPVTLQYKSGDARAQHYTLCVYFNTEKCIELKDRALNEVVVFIVAKNTPPLELVATKIQHDQIVGYLEVPTGQQ
jgi:hypothetical protein